MLPQVALPDHHGKVRMYKLNKKKQMIRQKWLKDVEEPGCHNTFKSRKVHRFTQIGYDYCILYAQDSCQEGSEVLAKWEGRKYKNADFDVDQPQLKIFQGAEWFLDPEKNVTVRSWYCEYGSD